MGATAFCPLFCVSNMVLEKKNGIESLKDISYNLTQNCSKMFSAERLSIAMEWYTYRCARQRPLKVIVCVPNKVVKKPQVI